MDVEIIDDTSDNQSNGSNDNQSNGSSSATTQNASAPNQSKLVSEAVSEVCWPSSTRMRRRREMDHLEKEAARLGLTSMSRNSRIIIAKDTAEFLQDFNPESSNREKRKLNRKLVQNHKRAYDGKGILLVCNKDLCDCLNERCPGCFFPCPKCRSCKCGHECRQFRKWVYESTEVQGTKTVIQNPYKHLLKKNP